MSRLVNWCEQRGVERHRLRPVGTGRPFVRALARIIVRRELIFARLIPDPDACLSDEQAG